MTLKHLEISLMAPGELSIDDETKPAGNIEIREFENDKWIGGSYATYDNLVKKVKEALDDDHAALWQDDGGEG
jgi:hypothetical protein